MTTLTLPTPDDWHVHFRDGEVLKNTVLATAAHFQRALVMPNLKPPLTTLKSLLDYRERILKILPNTHTFSPIMTFYLNETLSPTCLEKSRDLSFISGAKLYPQGVTTNSEKGAQSIKKVYPLLALLEETNKVLQIHGESATIDIFERETHFLKYHLNKIIKNFPKLRIVLEHISTAKTVEFLENAPNHVSATITPHHLLYNRNDFLSQGLKPHYYCLPILKTKKDQMALRKAATSGNPKYFAGTDSAPHARNQKESDCCPAGIYNAPYALPIYAEVFETCDALDKLPAFLSHHGADFYQLPRNKHSISLSKTVQNVPETLPFGRQTVVPIAAGTTLSWSVHAV